LPLLFAFHRRGQDTASVMNTFDRDGISFRYPTNWRVDAEEGDGGWTVTLSSPDTAFAILSLRPDASDPADLADQTLEAIKSEYQELDAENAVQTISGRAAIGHDIDFMTVDTTTICRTRCLDTPAGPLLVMCQTSEYDHERNDPVLRAIVASLSIAEE
jgi:hypothetical protein